MLGGTWRIASTEAMTVIGRIISASVREPAMMLGPIAGMSVMPPTVTPRTKTASPRMP